MATRALVGFIQSDAAGNIVLTSTYNHYDGYPENLGKGLDNHYSMPEEALKVASMGYISYMNPETGEIEAKHKEPADKTKLSEDFRDAMLEVAEVADSYGADYIYIYDVENLEWGHVEMSGGTRSTAEKLMIHFSALDGGIFRDPIMDLPAAPDQIGEDYTSKWNKFLNEADMDNEVVKDTSSAIRDAEIALKGEHGPHVEIYIDSLANDIRLNGDKSYDDYDEEDWKEDFTAYIADKMEALD